MPTLKVQAPDGKFLSLPVDPSVDPKEYEGMINDALEHYSGSIAPANAPQPSLAEMASSSLQKAGEDLGPIMAAGHKLGNMAYKGWGDIADVLTNPNHPLYSDVLGTLTKFALSGNQGAVPNTLSPQETAQAIKTIPAAAGVPNTNAGLALSGIAGLSELGATKPLTNAIEGAGQTIANKALRMARVSGPAADLASSNMGQFLMSGPEDAQALSNQYSNSAKLLGIKPMEETLGEYPGASGEYAKAVKGYSGKKGINILKDGTDASYQDLHNIVEATTEMRMRPQYYRDMGIMRDVPKQVAIDLDSMKKEALSLIGQKAGHELALEYNNGNLINGANSALPELDEMRGRLATYEAANSLPQLRKDLAIAHIESETNSIAPLNMNKTTSQLGTFETLGGLAAGLSGHPMVAAYAASRSPAITKGILGAGYGAYQLANPQAIANINSLLQGNQNGTP